MVSHPAYDPNVFARGIRRDEWRGLIQDRKHPSTTAPCRDVPAGLDVQGGGGAGALEESVGHAASRACSCSGGIPFGNHFLPTAGRRGARRRQPPPRDRRSCDVFFYQAGRAARRRRHRRNTRAASASGLRPASGSSTRKRASFRTRVEAPSLQAAVVRGRDPLGGDRPGLRDRPRRSRWRTSPPSSPTAAPAIGLLREARRGARRHGAEEVQPEALADGAARRRARSRRCAPRCATSS
jgi:hypothetical protein